MHRGPQDPLVPSWITCQAVRVLVMLSAASENWEVFVYPLGVLLLRYHEPSPREVVTQVCSDSDVHCAAEILGGFGGNLYELIRPKGKKWERMRQGKDETGL